MRCKQSSRTPEQVIRITVASPRNCSCPMKSEFHGNLLSRGKGFQSEIMRDFKIREE
jgi:hypothetical protein